MTEDQHGEVLRLASILLLGFVLPHSTGNELCLLENAPRHKYQTAEGSELDVMAGDDYILQMPLEDRLSKAVHHNDANEFGEYDTLMDPFVEVAFHQFLYEGITPLLERRPAHRTQVDLWHVIAMIIDPRPLLESLPDRLQRLNDSHAAYWLKTRRLMQSTTPVHFQANYDHRWRLAQLVARSATWPVLEDETATDPVGPLLYGAMFHLQTSLRCFGQRAISKRDAHIAHCALVSMACQARNVPLLLEEWRYLLHLTMEDRSLCPVDDCSRSETSKQILQPELPLPRTSSRFCPHVARGRLLGNFAVRSGRRGTSEPDLFVQEALRSLTDVIEWQTDCWDASDEAIVTEDSRPYPPCLLESLLCATKQLACFRPAVNEEVVQCAIQLLRHFHCGIASEAANMLVMVFHYAPKHSVDSFVFKILESIKLIMEHTAKSLLFVEDLVGSLAQHSPPFASNLFLHLLDKTSKVANREAIDRLVAMVATNCPMVVARNYNKLFTMFQNRTELSPHIAVALLSSRQTYFFNAESDKHDKITQNIVSLEANGWTLFQIARQCLLLGNFAQALTLYKSVASSFLLSEKNYVWVCALEKIASGEAHLIQHGATGIPHAAEDLHTAVSYLQFLQSFSDVRKEGFSFQIRFLLLRLDFLDLVTILRHLTMQMRLTASGPTKHTRSYNHLRNTIIGFGALASRYKGAFQRHGMCFKYGFSGTCLRVLEVLSSMMKEASVAVFLDIISVPMKKDVLSIDIQLGDARDPLSMLLRHLDELVVQPMRISVDSVARAAALLEVIEGVLMVPIPFPRDFMCLSPTIPAFLRLSAQPEELNEHGVHRFTTIEAYPSAGFSFCATGHFPQALLQQSKKHVSKALIWYQVYYDGPLREDEFQPDEQLDEYHLTPPIQASIAAKVSLLSTSSPAVAPLSLDGFFFISIDCPPLFDEGWYSIKACLGGRDVSGGEWEIPTNGRTQSISIRNTRSR